MGGPNDCRLFGDRRRGRERFLGGRRGCLLAGRRLRRGRFRGRRGGRGLRLGDRFALQSFGVGEAPDAIGGGLVDARRVALDADLELVREVDDDGILDAQLSCQLVDPNLLRRQNSPFP
jgi:hypothetical protein